MFVSVICVLLPRFELVVAAAARPELLGSPAALAPEPGREQLVGEVSAAAEGFGIHPGMRMGEALARCPRLALVPPDPVGVADAWERVLARLEAVGARVEPGHPGLACFDARGLQRLHGGSLEGVLGAAHAALRHRIPPSPESGTGGIRLGAGPSRFCAVVAAAARADANRFGVVSGAGSNVRRWARTRRMRPASDSGSRKTTRSRQVPPSTSAAPRTTARSVRPSRSRRASNRSTSSPSARSS